MTPEPAKTLPELIEGLISMPKTSFLERFIAQLNEPGGHILVALFVFLVGVSLVFTGQDVGKQILSASLGSLWTALQVKQMNGLTPPK